MNAKEASSLKRLQARMDAIPKKVRAAVKPAIEAGAKEIASKAKALTPVDTGALRDSIGFAFGDGPKTRATGAFRQAAGSGLDADLKATVFAGNDDAYYARFVEFGTSTGVPAQPFFFPAWRLGSKRAKSRIQRAISKAVREGWK